MASAMPDSALIKRLDMSSPSQGSIKTGGSLHSGCSLRFIDQTELLKAK